METVRGLNGKKEYSGTGNMYDMGERIKINK